MKTIEFNELMKTIEFNELMKKSCLKGILDKCDICLRLPDVLSVQFLYKVLQEIRDLTKAILDREMKIKEAAEELKIYEND